MSATLQGAAALGSVAQRVLACVDWGDGGGGGGANATATGPAIVAPEYTVAIVALCVSAVLSLALVSWTLRVEELAKSSGSGCAECGCNQEKEAGAEEKQPPLTAASAKRSGILASVASLPGALGFWCWTVLLSLVAGLGTATGGAFMSYWFSIVLILPLLCLTLALLRRNCERRRGTGPCALAAAGTPCVLVQPTLLVLQGFASGTGFFVEPVIFWSVTATTWIGNAAILGGVAWNASADRKLKSAWERRRQVSAAAASSPVVVALGNSDEEAGRT